MSETVAVEPQTIPTDVTTTSTTVATPPPPAVNDGYFAYEYVKQLRDEAAANRVKAKQLSEEVTKVRSQLETLAELPDKYQSALDELKEIYLAKIPEDKREKFKSFNLDVLKTVAEEWQQPVKNSLGTQAGEVDLAKGWNEMTQEELNTLAQTNPAHFQKLLNESIYGKKE